MVLSDTKTANNNVIVYRFHKYKLIKNGKLVKNPSLEFPDIYKKRYTFSKTQYHTKEEAINEKNAFIEDQTQRLKSYNNIIGRFLCCYYDRPYVSFFVGNEYKRIKVTTEYINNVRNNTDKYHYVGEVYPRILSCLQVMDLMLVDGYTLVDHQNNYIVFKKKFLIN